MHSFCTSVALCVPNESNVHLFTTYKKSRGIKTENSLLFRYPLNFSWKKRTWVDSLTIYYLQWKHFAVEQTKKHFVNKFLHEFLSTLHLHRRLLHCLSPSWARISSELDIDSSQYRSSSIQEFCNRTDFNKDRAHCGSAQHEQHRCATKFNDMNLNVFGRFLSFILHE